MKNGTQSVAGNYSAYRRASSVVIFLALLWLMSTPLLNVLRAEEEFKVGIITSLSGPAAPYGMSIRNSMELAASEHPELFRRIRFIYEDVGYDTKQAALAFQKLVRIDRVNLMYTWGLNFCKALAPVAESEHVPLVAQCLLPDISKGRQFVLRFYSSTDDYMKKQVEILAGKNLSNIAMVVADTPHLQDMTAALKRSLRPGQKIVFEQSFLPSESDFRTVIGKLKHTDAQVIGVFLSTGQIATFYKQAKALSLNAQSFGSNWFDSLQEVKAAEGTMDGATFVTTGFSPEFKVRYQEKFKEPGVLSFGGPAYELALTIGKLFGNSGSSLKAEDIIPAFSSMPPQAGTASGPYSFVDEIGTGRYFQFPVVVKQVKGSEISDF